MKPLTLVTLMLVVPLSAAVGCSSEDGVGGSGGGDPCNDSKLSCFDACMCRSKDSVSCGLTCPSGTGGSAGSTGGSPSTGGSGGSGAVGGSSGSGGTGGVVGPVGRCSDPPPAGAPRPAAPKAYSGGTCPTLKAGVNAIQSTTARQFILVIPSGATPTDRMPVVFLWHWLNSSANSFLERGEVQKAADAQRFIAVIPDAKSGNLFSWPYSAVDSQAAVDEDLRFFDDMLACVSQQFSVNEDCVATAGVSAGALWSAQLSSYRSEYLSSFISLSGGTGGGTIKEFGNPGHKLPAVVLWGGPQDTCVVINFEQTSKDLEQKLTAGGHFFLECIHNCRHGEPPIESGMSSKYQMLFDFVLDHPFWLGPGQSPYTGSGIPASFPPWCGIGANSSMPRTGTCPPPSC